MKFYKKRFKTFGIYILKSRNERLLNVKRSVSLSISDPVLGHLTFDPCKTPLPLNIHISMWISILTEHFDRALHFAL